MDKKNYPKGSILGKIIRLVGEPICYLLGKIVKEQDHNILYDERISYDT